MKQMTSWSVKYIITEKMARSCAADSVDTDTFRLSRWVMLDDAKRRAAHRSQFGLHVVKATEFARKLPHPFVLSLLLDETTGRAA